MIGIDQSLDKRPIDCVFRPGQMLAAVEADCDNEISSKSFSNRLNLLHIGRHWPIRTRQTHTHTHTHTRTTVMKRLAFKQNQQLWEFDLIFILLLVFFFLNSLEHGKSPAFEAMEVDCYAISDDTNCLVISAEDWRLA